MRDQHKSKMGNITSSLCSCFGEIVGGLYEPVETESNTSEQISELFQLLENEVLDSADEDEEAFPYNPFDDCPMNPFGDDEDEEEFPPYPNWVENNNPINPFGDDEEEIVPAYPIGVDLNYPINLLGDDDDEEMLPPQPFEVEDDNPMNPFGDDDEEQLIFPIEIEIVIEEELPLLHRG